MSEAFPCSFCGATDRPVVMGPEVTICLECTILASITPLFSEEFAKIASAVAGAHMEHYLRSKGLYDAADTWRQGNEYADGGVHKPPSMRMAFVRRDDDRDSEWNPFKEARGLHASESAGIERAVHKILLEWDPIGVADRSPDEYSAYEPEIVAMVRRGAAVLEFSNHLLNIELCAMYDSTRSINKNRQDASLKLAALGGNEVVDPEDRSHPRHPEHCPEFLKEPWFPTCGGDGHYLCRTCSRFKEETE